MNHLTTLQIGQTFIFKGKLENNQDFRSDEVPSCKVLSFFPKLNTKICDLQSLKIAELSKQFPAIKFISISMDSNQDAKAWCQKNVVENLFFVSDAYYQDFAQQSNLWFDDQKSMLSRGLILIDKNNKIIALSINENVRQEPNYDVIINHLNNC